MRCLPPASRLSYERFAALRNASARSFTGRGARSRSSRSAGRFRMWGGIYLRSNRRSRESSDGPAPVWWRRVWFGLQVCHRKRRRGVLRRCLCTIGLRGTVLSRYLRSRFICGHAIEEVDFGLPPLNSRFVFCFWPVCFVCSDSFRCRSFGLRNKGKQGF